MLVDIYFIVLSHLPSMGVTDLPERRECTRTDYFIVFTLKNIIDLLPGSRNNGYKLVYGGSGEVFFLFPQRIVGLSSVVV